MVLVDPEDPRVRGDQSDQQVKEDQQDPKEPKVPMAIEVHGDLQVLPDQVVNQDHRVRLALL